MNDTALFLTALGQALSAMTLYGDGHPVRVAARTRALDALVLTLGSRGPLRLSFLEGDVVVGTRVMHELRGWDWGAKLANAGVQRLEIDAIPTPSETDIDILLDALHTRLQAPAGTPSPPLAVRGLRAGPLTVVGIGSDSESEDAEVVDLLDALAQNGMTHDAEADAVRWIHDEVANARAVPMAEVEAVVHSLAAAMHRDQHMMLPLLELKSVDQYTTTHSCNVAMLSMGLAEQLGLASGDVRAIGTAALLHDIGKVRVPVDILVKPGQLTDAELAEIRRHPLEGARILSARGQGNALAAIVAYEHHVWEDGAGGYPTFDFARRCHYASRLVHVCDLYDALSTRRPYRNAWPRERTLAMLQAQAGVEVDAEIVRAFLALTAHAEEARTPLTVLGDASRSSDWNGAVARAVDAHMAA